MHIARWYEADDLRPKLVAALKDTVCQMKYHLIAVLSLIVEFRISVNVDTLNRLLIVVASKQATLMEIANSWASVLQSERSAIKSFTTGKFYTCDFCLELY